MVPARLRQLRFDACPNVLEDGGDYGSKDVTAELLALIDLSEGAAWSEKPG
ncbi:MAG: hypothetical protein P8L31_11240 [Pseudomonadales bacterium]|nr:hypothetical protein [Pseudomonadales bacterium]